MSWSIKNIENQIAKTEGAYTLTYAIEGMPTIKKHELSTNNGVFYKEITPVGNLTGFSVNVEATSELKNCYIRCTDSEGHSQTSNLFTLQFVSPLKNDPPKIQNIKIKNVNQSGVYQIVYDATDNNSNVNLIHYLKIDNEEYKQINPTKSGNTFTYNGTSLSNGTHVCNLKVSDGSLETESSVFQIIIPKIVNNPPTISEVIVEETSYKGRYRISYTATDIDKTDLITHKLKIDTNEYEVIKPISVDNKYVYNGLGLSVGTHQGIIEISDGVNIVKSNPFSIVINKESGVGIKRELAKSKTDYDNAYNSLITTVRDIIDKMTNDKSYDNSIGASLVEKAYKDYTEKSVILKDISQQAIDIIGNNKTSDAKENLAKEIGDLTNALGSLDQSMNDVFKDGILTEAEKITIRQHLQSLSLEKVDVDNQYNSLLSKFNKADLNYAENGVVPPDWNDKTDFTDKDKPTREKTPAKYPDKKWYLDLYNNLKKAYENYSKKYENLILIIDYILKKDGILDTEDLNKKDKAFNEYVLAIGEYSKRASLAIEGIGRNETENNETLVQTFKGEYIRSNKENSAKLTALTQTTNGLTTQFSEFKQTADKIQTQVNKNTNGLTTQSSQITQLANKISSKVSYGEFGTLIEQNPSSVTVAVKKGTLVTTDEWGHTIWNGYLACDRLTSPKDHYPIISLFGDYENGDCAIDATNEDHVGAGDSIRLQWDRSNYIRVSTNWFAVYQQAYGREAMFSLTAQNGLSFKGKTIFDGSGNLNTNIKLPQIVRDLDSICKVQTGTWEQLSPNSDGNVFCGSKNSRWDTVFSVNGVKTSSDRREKEKITYLENNNISKFNLNLINDRENIYNISPKIIESDLYDFIKNDLHLATYMFKSNKENIPRDSQIGFIAQDIENTKLGKYIVVGNSSKGDNLMVHQNNYINTIAGALKVAINKIENLETEINNLKNGGNK